MKYAKIIVMMAVITVVTITATLASPPPPPPPPDEPTVGERYIGGSPIGEGIFILTIAAIAYGAHKWKYRRKLCE